MPTNGEAKFYYLDLRPDTFRDANGVMRQKTALRRWGTPRCFQEIDLYTTTFGNWQSTDIEKLFFGRVDDDGAKAVAWFNDYSPGRVSSEAFQGLLNFMSLQKLRTPRGLAYLAALARTSDKNVVLLAMQRFQNLHCSIWTEAVWSLVDATSTTTKFIVSDHPVTVYNRDCFPASKWCQEPLDPEVWLLGTHTLFPLSLTRLLVFTNLAWVRNPYQRASRQRPNPFPLRPARPFNFMELQAGRELTEVEVNQINFIIKKRARRYIAAASAEWLYPERTIPSEHWSKLDDRYLLMPDPRSVQFGGQMVIGYKGRPADVYDEYGRRPGQSGYRDKQLDRAEWQAFHAFQGEYARLFGPRRRGTTYELHRKSPREEDSPDFHAYHLECEQKYLPSTVKPRRDRRAT